MTIPLSLLFAIVVMNATGASGNLMSLGALDFGLLVDGAVIIVENAVRRLAERREELGRDLTGHERTEVVRVATMEVRAASVFGEAIIAVVYLPILALGGLEGKLFRPMATTVLLALGGAFILSLTVVPVLTSYLVRPKRGSHETVLLRLAKRAYAPMLRNVLSWKRLTLTLTVFALAGAVALFTKLGAEFVPQLDEGDLLIEARRLPAASLSESVDTALRVERAIRKFPEVKSVVSRTGSPEIATDPMGVEASDIYIALEDRSKWPPGVTKESLGVEIMAAVSEAVPEISGAMSQPIEMRTNELVAGIRSDVGILVYGTDLDELAGLGEKIASAVKTVPGVVDVRVEQVAGLKYLRVTPDRAKLARYGLSVADVNQLTQTMAVGFPTGVVLEGERRFGIVVKTKHDFKDDLDALLGLPLKSVTGQIVPLGDVAALDFVDGPAEIARSSQSRRLTVEFNVSGRDLVSVVRDSQNAVQRALTLPVGYRLEWGGEFEHYLEAKNRLLFVVPIALTMIALLLWMAFRSLRVAAIILLNVPFAIVGGVVGLAVMRVPFSIPAGIGFVALFGVAVLNGLVLVSSARHLEEEGKEPAEATRQAALGRLRPVLMTALVASLGFLPMATSTAPGSEVQRPLAIVVIGGLVSATLLTLLVLPVILTMLGKSRRGEASA